MSERRDAPAGLSGLQLDLLTVILRLRQIQSEREDGLWLLWDRILPCDLPRLESHLTPDTLAWMAANPDVTGSLCAVIITRFTVPRDVVFSQVGSMVPRPYVAIITARPPGPPGGATRP